MKCLDVELIIVLSFLFSPVIIKLCACFLIYIYIIYIYIYIYIERERERERESVYGQKERRGKEKIIEESTTKKRV